MGDDGNVLMRKDSVSEYDRELIHIHDLPLPENVEKRRLLVHHSMETEEQNNKRLLTKIRERMQRWVGAGSRGVR